MHNFNAKSYYISCHIPITYCMIDDEADLEAVVYVDDTSTPELVCAASQFSDVNNSSSVQVKERNNEININKEVDCDNTDTEINDQKLKCNFCFPLLL